MQSDIQSRMSQSQMPQPQISQSQMPGSQAPHTCDPELKTMRAAVYRENGIITLGHRPVPALADPRDAIIRIVLTTICPNDIHIKHGAVLRAVPGTILEHELVGVVEQTRETVKKFKQRDRTVVNVETFCGECHFCRRGYVNNCTHEYRG